VGGVERATLPAGQPVNEDALAEEARCPANRHGCSRFEGIVRHPQDLPGGRVAQAVMARWQRHRPHPHGGNRVVESQHRQVRHGLIHRVTVRIETGRPVESDFVVAPDQDGRSLVIKAEAGEVDRVVREPHKLAPVVRFREEVNAPAQRSDVPLPGAGVKVPGTQAVGALRDDLRVVVAINIGGLDGLIA
jgi:hypothetical protein